MCCGAVTSLSPRCHPAGARIRRILPKPQCATSVIHKRQPLSLSYSLAHTASHSSISHSVASSHPLAFYFNLVSLQITSTFFSLCPPSTSGFIHSEHLALSLTPLSSPYFLLFPLLYPHPTEKSLAHYIFEESQLSVVAVSWEPQDIPDPNSTKSPAFVSSDDSVCQTHTSLMGWSQSYHVAAGPKAAQCLSLSN